MRADMVEAGLNDWRTRWSNVLEEEGHAKRQAQAAYITFSEHKADLAPLQQALADVGAVLQRADRLLGLKLETAVEGVAIIGEWHSKSLSELLS